MRYALLLHNEELEPADIPQAELESFQAAFNAYAKSLDAAGVLVAAEILGPSALTSTVTVRDGALNVQDGPFAESKEMLAGVFVIDVPDLDAALAWAEKCPGAQYGTVEVRPAAISFVEGQWQS